jgi:lipid-binding SYLF domain-containing protein
MCACARDGAPDRVAIEATICPYAGQTLQTQFRYLYIPEKEEVMRRALPYLGVAALVVQPLSAQKKEQQRLTECATVLREVLNVPEDIPKDLFDKAECVIVFPSVKKFAIGVGGSYGRGAITCRKGEHFTGGWSAPAMFALEGGNIGFQLGGQATDFVLLVMNDKGANSVLGSKVKLGADAAAAAGPKGRTAAAATDVVMKAEILSYSRSRGLFAGVSLEESTLRSDNGANKNLYGREFSAREIVRQGKVRTPPAGRPLVSLLNHMSSRNLSANK